MTRISKLHQNPLHKDAEKTPFILRLRFKHLTSQPQKTDCINLFIQLHYLYKAMEARLVELKEEELLSIFSSEPWLNRSEKMAADIRMMKARLSQAEREALIEDVMPAFGDFIKTIQHYNPVQLFAALSVRCLGDAYGGQALNKYNQQVFSRNPFTDSFYSSVKGKAISLSQQVNAAELGEENEALFYSAADAMFLAHIHLFEQMECSRKEVKGSRHSCNRYMLFSVVTATIGVTALAYSM